MVINERPRQDGALSLSSFNLRLEIPIQWDKKRKEGRIRIRKEKTKLLFEKPITRKT